MNTMKETLEDVYAAVSFAERNDIEQAKLLASSQDERGSKREYKRQEQRPREVLRAD